MEYQDIKVFAILVYFHAIYVHLLCNFFISSSVDFYTLVLSFLPFDTRRKNLI